MPITQERMIDLIEAARDLYNALNTLTLAVRQAQADNPNIAPIQELAAICIGLGPLPDTLMTLGVEERHFAKFRNRNERERIRMENRRAGSPNPKRMSIRIKEGRSTRSIEETQVDHLQAANAAMGITSEKAEELMRKVDTEHWDKVFKKVPAPNTTAAVLPDGTRLRPDGTEVGQEELPSSEDL